MCVIDSGSLKAILPDSEHFVRVKDGEVKGLAIAVHGNPEAPEVIVVSDKAPVVSRVKLLIASEKAVPVYIKRGVNSWAYRGDFFVKEFSQESHVIDKYRKNYFDEEGGVFGVLFMEEADFLGSSNPGVSWRNSPKARKASKAAAVQMVREYYSKRGYYVEDRRRMRYGYDLFVAKDNQFTRVEVKGTAGDQPDFWLSHKEMAASVHPAWRVAIVTNALGDCPSKPRIYTIEEVEEEFDVEPSEWRVKLKL